MIQVARHLRHSLVSKLRTVLLWAAAVIPIPAAAQGLESLAPSPPVRFAADIDAFARQDAVSPPSACPVLFVGSSSIRMWSSLAEDMAPYPVLNRGFGGAEIEDVVRHFDRVVAAYHPRAIVFYAGENDIAGGKTPEQVVAEFRRFMDMKVKALGPAPVFFTSLKPSLLRFDQFEAQTKVNTEIHAMADQRDDLEYIDVVQVMMQDGRPKPLFVGDGLHMGPEGYALWRETIGGGLSHAHVENLPCGQAPDVAKTSGQPGPG